MLNAALEAPLLHIAHTSSSGYRPPHAARAAFLLASARAAASSQPGNIDHGWGLEPRPLLQARREVAVNFTTD